jgi:4-diphosphocytidyl-2-C-methyl-D-erythritol kinase
MKLYAYAKINLSLYVIGLKDGMHLLDSIMLTCKDIKDTIIIKKSSIDSLKFSGCQTDKIDVNNNTVKKALGLFRKNTGIYTPLDIKVIKKIPIMAGLGGSSADAACLLRGLAKMFGLNIQNSSIQNAAKNTGSDVAYMLDRRAARVSGVGECVEYIDNNTKLYMLIAMDECISTKECFAVFDKMICLKRL